MRHMSFSHTCDQLHRREKRVTRRLGWEHVQPGDLLQGVKKSRGLRKGEKVEKLEVIRVLDNRRERLDAITAEDVKLEGYPDWTPAQFVAHFCKSFRCEPERVISRIEFEYVEDLPVKRTPKQLSAVRLFAWLGSAHGPAAGQIEIKRAMGESSLVPLVAIGEVPIARQILINQLQAEADRYGEPIRLMMFKPLGIVMTIEPRINADSSEFQNE